MRYTHLLIGTILTGLAACGGQGDEGVDAPRATSDAPARTLEQVESVGVRNARMPAPNLVTGGQPTQEQLGRLADLGYRRFISLRPADERGAGWEEAHEMPEGGSFSRVPVSGSAGLTRQSVEALDRLLDEAGDEPTVVYCASGNRVGALLALRAYWLDGAEPDAALELGRAAGLRGLEAAVTELMEEGR